MTSYPVNYVDRDGTGQSWDVLRGETIGPVHVSRVSNIITEAEWKAISPFFTPQELACKGTDRLYQYVPALKAYNALRRAVLRPHSPSSAYRSPEHNRDVGGGLKSRHMAGAAYDIPRRAMKVSEAEFVRTAKDLGFNGIGYYRTFIHVDFRAKLGTWGRPLG